MCIICQKQNDFSFEHLEQEAKKLRTEQLGNKAKEIKDSIAKYEVWLVGDRCDGFEKQAIEQTIQYLKEAQYILSRRM